MNGGKHDPISIPAWAKKLCELLDPKSTNGGLAVGIENGSIEPEDSLQYDVGISPTELASLAEAINSAVIDQYAKPGTRHYVTATELLGCKTIVQLMNLVFDRLEAG